MKAFVAIAALAAHAAAASRIAEYASGARRHQPPPPPRDAPAPTTRYPPHPPPLTASGLHDPVGSVAGLITRRLGAAYLPYFDLRVIPQDASTGNDVFELDYNASTKQVVVRGSAGYAIAAGLNWYIKYETNSSFSWGRGGSGNHIALPPPDELVPPAPLRMAAPVRYRYAYNVRLP